MKKRIQKLACAKLSITKEVNSVRTMILSSRRNSHGAKRMDSHAPYRDHCYTFRKGNSYGIMTSVVVGRRRKQHRIPCWRLCNNVPTNRATRSTAIINNDLLTSSLPQWLLNDVGHHINPPPGGYGTTNFSGLAGHDQPLTNFVQLGKPKTIERTATARLLLRISQPLF